MNDLKADNKVHQGKLWFTIFALALTVSVILAILSKSYK